MTGQAEAVWADLVDRIRDSDLSGTIKLVGSLDDAAKKAVADRLPRYMTDENRRPDARWGWWRQAPSLRAAGVVCLGSPAAVAGWLFRRELREGASRDVRPDEELLRLLRDRPEAWRADLAGRMVERLRVLADGGIHNWTVAVSLARQTRIVPPENDALVLGWLRSFPWGPTVREAAAEVAKDPLFPHLAPRIWGVDARDVTGGQVVALSALSHGDGPLGSGVAYAMACGMTHRLPIERAAVTDAILTLTARGRMPSSELGTAIADLVDCDLGKRNRIVSVLNDAIQGGAHAEMWDVIAGALPWLLPQPGGKPRAGVADLVEAGTKAAQFAGVRGTIPAVAAIATRGGSSRLTMEARRLHALISS